MPGPPKRHEQTDDARRRALRHWTPLRTELHHIEAPLWKSRYSAAIRPDLRDTLRIARFVSNSRN
jgi:hypothetical protein